MNINKLLLWLNVVPIFNSHYFLGGTKNDHGGSHYTFFDDGH